jgi:hypothetical protein
MNFEQRLQDVKRFYILIEELEARCGGKRRLSDATAKMGLPRRGVYFFLENGEERSKSGSGLRVVRVGTHAIIKNAKATLWDRLRQHRGHVGGSHPGSGDHRGSVFRKHVGTAIIARDQRTDEGSKTWGKGNNAPRQVRNLEYPLEVKVSRIIRAMPFLWLNIDDEPGPNSMRATIERNSIALLSNYNYPETPIDPSSPGWPGHWAKSTEIRRSGLWNVDHVKEDYEPGFLKLLKDLVDQGC